MRNHFFTLDKRHKLFVDLYTNLFFDTPFVPLSPKTYLNIRYDYVSLFLLSQSAWNFRKNLLDFSNLRLGWTASENAAFILELRYRSSWDWRKAERDNFILDVTRDEVELFISPLSDRRLTFLTHMYFRFNPLWTCHIQSHHGWGRKYEPSYNEIKVDLFRLLSSNWRLRISYQHNERDDRVTAALSLIKSKRNIKKN